MNRHISIILITLTLLTNFDGRGSRKSTFKSTFVKAYPTASSIFQDIYIVKPGDTKIGIARNYGISVAHLEQLNPHIIEDLKIGSQIRFSAKTKFIIKSGSENTNTKLIKKPETEPDFHIIKTKETLYSLAKKAKMPISQFLKLNPILEEKEVTIGDTVRMSVTISSKKETQKELTQNSLEIEKPSTVGYKDLNITSVKNKKDKTIPQKEVVQTQTESTKTPLLSKSNLASTIVKNTEKTIFFILPFDISEINKPSAEKNTKDQNDFIKGALIAVEAARNLGLRINTKFLKEDELEKKPDLQAKIQQQASGIILNSSTKTSPVILKKISNNSTPIINTNNSQTYTGADNLFNGLPSTAFEINKVLDYLKSQNGQLIVIQDQENIDLNSSLSKNFTKVKYLTVMKNSLLNTADLKKSLSNSETNFVIMNTNSTKTILSGTTALMGEMKSKNIHLVFIESSKMPDEDQVSHNRFKVLKTIHPGIQTNDVVFKKFSQEFKQQYKQEPSTSILKGFDVTYDTLLRLFQTKSFKDSAETEDTEYTFSQFDYKKNTDGGYSNQAVSIMQFNENTKVELVK